MPPWLPEPGYGDFADSRRLSNQDLAKIKRWVNANMPEGNAAQAPAAPKYTSEWQLGPPDLILTAPQSFQVPADGQDLFRNFVYPVPVARTRYVRAMEILPGNARVVHHANILIDRTAELRRQHPNDWRAGIPGMRSKSAPATASIRTATSSSGSPTPRRRPAARHALARRPRQ